MTYVERNGLRIETPSGGSRSLKLHKWRFDDPYANDYTKLTPISQRDPEWQEAVLVALTKLRPARAWTSKLTRPVIATLLELTF